MRRPGHDWIAPFGRFRSPDNPAVVRARKTLEDLQQRLDRIDRVLVDVVETYPTMVDFSRGPSEYKITSQPGFGAVSQDSEDAAHRLGVEPRRENGRVRVTDRDELANPKLEQQNRRQHNMAM